VDGGKCSEMLVLGPKKQRDLLLDLTIHLDGCTVVSNKTLLMNISKLFQGQLFSIYVTLQKSLTFCTKLMLTYKGLNGLAPTYLSDLVLP
jgi:hypothetical protein